MKWFAAAPANIALIKYMGKQDADKNIPANGSLSYTLNNLESFVELESWSGKQDLWEPLDLPGAFRFDLSQAGQTRFLNHLEWLKTQFNYTGHFTVRSCNNFPMGSGLASSASSFAALTLCFVRAMTELQSIQEPPLENIAALSRIGSGSSCRSFYSPWALWEGEHVNALELPYQTLLHECLIISHDEKAISSSEAHQLVTRSPGYANRATRANKRLQDCIMALQSENWEKACDIVWEDFLDMHDLFATAEPSFGYMTDTSQKALTLLRDYWDKNNDGPMVTMDAGPNIHLLYRPDQKEMMDTMKRDLFHDNYDML